MPPIRFDPQNDLAPTSFDEALCRLALELKRLGLPWSPHVGCFAWDPDGRIRPESPFPNRVYFILSLPRFIDIFGSIEAIAERLVWLPTWHQARLLCRKLGADAPHPSGRLSPEAAADPAEELASLYKRLIIRLGG
ncbi:MAG: hypothetical protein MUD16_14715 [Desulfobacterales bacterium]|nr:hypothetical protein [Desulfobacterales bacterium]